MQDNKLRKEFAKIAEKVYGKNSNWIATQPRCTDQEEKHVNLHIIFGNKKIVSCITNTE